MKITIIHGQSHNGTTCHTARSLAEKLGGRTTEFFLPKDFGEMCIGCTLCINKDEKLCPHYKSLAPITRAVDEADILIMESPVYVYHVTSAMKAWLEHYGWRWLLHRPEESMFRKQVVCIATAAGGGQKSTCRDMADSASFWGAARIYKYGAVVRAMNWNGVTRETREKLDRDMTALASKIQKDKGKKKKPCLKTRLLFPVMSMIVKKRPDSADYAYWKSKGWLEGKRPWS